MYQIREAECPWMTMNNEDEGGKCLYDNGHIYRDHQSSPNNQEMYLSLDGRKGRGRMSLNRLLSTFKL